MGKQPPVFTPESLIVEAEELIDWNALKAYYQRVGIKCLNCGAAEIETFADGERIHHYNLTEHLAELNRLAAEHPFSGFPPTLGQRFSAWFAVKMGGGAATGSTKKSGQA
jgi:hypothetical protein